MEVGIALPTIAHTFFEWQRLTMVIEHEFNISEYLGIATVGFFSCLSNIVAGCLEYPCWLRVEHEGNGEQPLDPFYFTLVFAYAIKSKTTKLYYFEDVVVRQ